MASLRFFRRGAFFCMLMIKWFEKRGLPKLPIFVPLQVVNISNHFSLGVFVGKMVWALAKTTSVVCSFS